MALKLQRISLRTQLTFMIFAASLVVILLTSALFVYWKISDARAEAWRISQTAVTILAQDFVRSTLLGKPDIAVDMADKIEAFDSISNAEFLTRDRVPVLIYNRPGHPKIGIIQPSNRDLTVTADYISVSLPVRYQGQEYGTAYFRLSQKLFNGEFFAFLKRLALAMPVLLLLSVPLALFLQNMISRPIRRLARALVQFGEGGITQVNEQDAKSREMRMLFDGFNTMVEQIEHTRTQLGEQRERLLVTLESIADGVIATDEQGLINYLNPAAEYITGWNESDAIGRPAADIYRLVDSQSDDPLSECINETLVSGSIHFHPDNTVLVTRNGEKLVIQGSIAPIRNHQQLTGCVIIFQNLTESRLLSFQLKHQASHDALTSLINRSEFERILRSALDHIHTRDSHSLLYLDLDQFKVINDTCGHLAGDVLLQQIATILQKTVREADTVARLGGDEFAVFLPNCNIRAATKIAEKLLGAISKYVFIWDERQFRVSMSIGVVGIDSRIQDYDSLMRAADLSCYAAKDYGRNRLHIYHEQDQDLIRRHSEMQWVEKLQNGLEQNRFVLYGQYIRSLSSKAGAQHLEILIRYLDRNGNIVTPSAFLPAAERYNLAPRIDQWVLENVFGDPRLVSLLRLDRGFRVNINLSGLTLSNPSTTRFITRLIQERQLPPRSLCFEITETAAVEDLTATSHFIRTMRLLGCEFALDDFGIGVSSFAYLRNLPVDYLKIDGSFVRDLDKNPVNAAMVSAINHIGHVLKIRTVAEFVENEAIMHKLRGIGVDYAQGFYVHSPSPLQEIYDVLQMPNGKSLS